MALVCKQGKCNPSALQGKSLKFGETAKFASGARYVSGTQNSTKSSVAGPVMLLIVFGLVVAGLFIFWENKRSSGSSGAASKNDAYSDTAPLEMDASEQGEFQNPLAGTGNAPQAAPSRPETPQPKASQAPSTRPEPPRTRAPSRASAPQMAPPSRPPAAAVPAVAPRAPAPKPAPKARPRSTWESAVDPSSGDTYYINTTTMQTSWELPKDFSTC